MRGRVYNAVSRNRKRSGFSNGIACNEFTWNRTAEQTTDLWKCFVAIINFHKNHRDVELPDDSKRKRETSASPQFKKHFGVYGFQVCRINPNKGGKAFATRERRAGMDRLQI